MLRRFSFVSSPSVSPRARICLKSAGLLFALGLMFAYGLGVGLRSWFPYEILVRAHEVLSGDADPQRTVSAEQLAGPDYLIHIRHAHRVDSIDIRLADYFEKKGATSKFSAMTCLSDEGRMQAELTGLVFEELGIVPTRLITSGSCRANEHAHIAFGRIDVQDSRHIYSSAIPQSQREEHVESQFHALVEAMAWRGVTVIIGHEGRPYDCKPIRCLIDVDSRRQGGVSVISQIDGSLNEVNRYLRLTDFMNSLAH